MIKQLNNRENEALNEAFFKTAEHFLETFKTLANKYKTAKPEIKREVMESFFSKREIHGKNLLLQPNPIMQEVSIIANLDFGRADSLKSETVRIAESSFLTIAKLIENNDLLTPLQKFIKNLKLSLA